jgi:tetratricopeptide (TPR) repeat protein
MGIALPGRKQNAPGLPRWFNHFQSIPRLSAGASTSDTKECALTDPCQTWRSLLQVSVMAQEEEPTPVQQTLKTTEQTTSEHQMPPGAGQATPFVGRDQELQQLKQVFLEVREKRSLAFVTLVGEPGVGKTRLAQHFARAARSSVPDTRVLWSTMSSGQGRVYEPLIQLLSERFAIVPAEQPHEAQSKITAAVEELKAPRPVEVAHLLAQLMEIPFQESTILEGLAKVPGQLQMRTYIALRRFLEHDAQQGCLVLCLDGIERCSTETANVLHYLADGLGQNAVLILATARPTLFRRHSQWGQGDFTHHRIALGPLGQEEAQALFRSALRVETDPPPSLTQIATHRLTGSPRAIEEFVRYLIERGLVKQGRRANSKRTIREAELDNVTLPRSHEETIKARVAMLPSEHCLLLQQAATIGEVFWVDAIVALRRAGCLSAEQPDGPSLKEISSQKETRRKVVERHIRDLCKRGFFAAAERSSVAGEVEYCFAYPPIWDLSYEATERALRKRYHRLVAQWLELRPEGRSEQHLAMIGWHLQRAGDGRGAAGRYRRAAEAARQRYFNHRAIRLYLRALGCLGHVDLVTRIHLWHDLGSVYQHHGDFDAALGAFERMVRLSWVVASRPKTAVAYNKMGRVWRQKGNTELASEYIRRGLDLYQQADDTRGVATSLDDLGQVYWLQGKYTEALAESGRALELRRQAGDKRSIASSLANIGNIEMDRGLLDEAEACHRDALRLLSELDDLPGRVSCLKSLGSIAFAKGQLAEAKSKWEEGWSGADQIGALPMQTMLLNNLGEVHLKLGKRAEARKHLTKALSLSIEIDDRRSQAEILRNRALLELQDGNSDLAREFGNQCLEASLQTKLPELIGKAHMALGEIQAATLFDTSGNTTQVKDAGTHFHEAIRVFEQTGNDVDLARARKRRGEYLVENGKLEEGRAELQQSAEIFSRIGIPEHQGIMQMLKDLGGGGHA